MLHFKLPGMQRSRTFSISLLVFACLTVGSLRAQVVTDTVPTSIDPELENIVKSNSAHEYLVGGITVTGTKRYDQQLLISIAGVNVGDKVMIPGGDNFSKALTNLWNQHLFSNMQIYFTKLEVKTSFFTLYNKCFRAGNRFPIELGCFEIFLTTKIEQYRSIVTGYHYRF